jgi:hypothetical protein
MFLTEHGGFFINKVVNYLSSSTYDFCIFGLYDQNFAAGHAFPYASIQYSGTFNIIPPDAINYISGSVHAYSSGINHGPPTLPGLNGILHNTEREKPLLCILI